MTAILYRLKTIYFGAAVSFETVMPRVPFMTRLLNAAADFFWSNQGCKSMVRIGGVFWTLGVYNDQRRKYVFSKILGGVWPNYWGTEHTPNTPWICTPVYNRGSQNYRASVWDVAWGNATTVIIRFTGIRFTGNKTFPLSIIKCLWLFLATFIIRFTMYSSSLRSCKLTHQWAC